ncbi:NADH:ubiquinone oxidoreductase subunit B14.5a [Opisthorchis viverrini]|uniref:NADH dehydrogenase [ubiquinone] 1 alpha subcomplex subunit 7 n=2 Tax=Opisthorchis viverrini TaxID=6198 RepID=A0A075AGF1_OPIVI|nr:hypothetical protein T265_04596 [Opisthorchis viverrini]KER28649.1 hypothetical protein T265_04596 [Opisthorchis viverrini]OON21846.1 NADH:ubiquinone oxidoreductase subunit B14.5a [Opisthorchis viverrini]
MSVRGGDRLTPLMARIRDFLLQRKYNNSLRYTENYSKRTQPPPFLPDGCSHDIAENAYYLRDERRRVSPPVEVFISGPKRLAESGSSSLPQPTSTSVTTVPGVKFNWDKQLPLD